MTEAKRFPNACVASPHYLASAAGLAVLADGGNAVDAAVATNLVLGVVGPYMCGYGGDLFAMVWAPADGRLHAYNGSGRAAAGATPEAVRSATGLDAMPATGPHSVTVPGAVDGWFSLLDRFGTRSFADLAKAALTYARDGFPVSSWIASHLAHVATTYTGREWTSEWQSIYGDVGTVLRQPALATTIEALGSDGRDAFYEGQIAEAIASTVQRFGAFITTVDLAAHRGEWVEPLATTYRDATVYEMPPNSQGVAALEALNIVEGLDLGAAESVVRQHVLIEAMKLALADRNEQVADPAHMRIDPSELASKRWAEQRRAEIDPEKASFPPVDRAAVGGTVYLCTADADGMLVSLIQSNYKGFGSGITVPGVGINLHNRGRDFSLDPSHVNVIAPNKLPRHTLMPAMVFRDGRPWLVWGTEGGDGQAQTHLQVLTRVIDDGLDIQDAMDMPRWEISPDDWSVSAESRFPHDLLIDLERRGHDVQMTGPWAHGFSNAIEVRDFGYAAGTDRRIEGAALGL